MALFIFIVTFLAMMIVASIVIVGWYAITRGRIEYNPDGSSFKTGKLFKGWHFFWAQTTGGEDTEFRGQALIDAAVKIQKEFKIGVTVDERGFIQLAEPLGTFFGDRRYWIEDLLKAKIVFADDTQRTFIVYKTVSRFKFPEWVRDPINSCPTCMASVYGTLLYFIFNLASGWHAFDWVGFSPFVGGLLFWPAFCTGVAFLNTVLAKKL